MRSRSHPDHSARRRVVTAAGITALALCASAVVAAPAQAADPVTINLVTINDFHGRLESSSPAGGAAVITTVVEQIRATNPNTLFVSAGDSIGASTFTSFIQQDTPTIAALNAAGLDVSAAGNHEFDRGFADLTDRVIPQAAFPILGANVYYADGTRALEAYEIITVAGDVDVAFVGAVTEEMPSLVSPAGIAGLEFRDIATEVNRAADEAVAEGADIVIALVHEGGSSNQADASNAATPLGAIVGGLDADVDMLVTAHTHASYAYDLNGLRITQSGQYGERLQNTALTYDRDSGDVSFAPTETTTFWNATVTPPVPLVVADLSNERVAEVATIVKNAVDFAKVQGSLPVGQITGDFRREIQPRTPTADNPSTTEEARGAESTLGNFVADVQLDQSQVRFPDTEIAFMNPGGLRANMVYASSGASDPAGNVTYAEAAAVQPFANTLVTMSLTGAQVKAVLEEQWQPSTASRPFLKLGVSKSLTYVTDYDAAAGSRITHLKLDGVAVDPAAEYRVVVNSFLASGGDNFRTLLQGTDRADSGLVDLEAMVTYFATNPPAAPDLAQRSIGVELSGQTGTYSAGQTVQIDLSSLDFTQTATAAATVSVSIGGVPVGIAAVDRTPVALTDEAGRASLSVVVPEGLSGVVPLTITTPVGTSFEVPIEIVDGVRTNVTAKVSSVRNTQPFTLEASVASRGATATGQIAVYIDGFAPIYATLVNGSASVELPPLPRGKFDVRVAYLGDGPFVASERIVKVNAR